MDSVQYNGFGILKFIFRDGTAIGGIRAFMDAGIINEQKYMGAYGK